LSCSDSQPTRNVSVAGIVAGGAGGLARLQKRYDARHTAYSVEKLSARVRRKNFKARESLAFPCFEETSALGVLRSQILLVSPQDMFTGAFSAVFQQLLKNIKVHKKSFSTA